MGIFETYSKRQRRLPNSGKNDVYRYDDLPERFRIQVIHIWDSALGVFYQYHGYSTGHDSPANKWWMGVHSILARERGDFHLGDGFSSPDRQCKQFLLGANVEDALDIIEISFRIIDRVVREQYPYVFNEARVTQNADDAIAELNHRFQEHGIGYQYVGGKLIRVDSQFTHEEVVKPALSLLNDAGFEGPADEFIRAFDHYRHGRYKEAIAEALKAFESTMKAICAARKWDHPANATAKPLADILFAKGLIPPELEGHFGSLRSAMESGLPTLSNKTSRHGQGAVPVAMPTHFGAYALHLTAANIVFLVQAHKALK